MADYRPAGKPAAEQAEADVHWLRQAIDLSRRCPPSESAFSVGAVLVGGAGEVMATGYSRELHPKDHAEEVALARAAGSGGLAPPAGTAGGSGGSAPRAGPAGGSAGSAPRAGTAAGTPPLAGSTLYSSLEPCLHRASRPRACAELIIEAGVGRVVIAWLEPPLFAEGGGAAALRRAGITVDEIPWLAELARAVNAHLPVS
jgi:diaminohydroxyphosphoribosylaminopyrimidine deaminase / 5-amino-6-(5-phosphoribosylamino)uracil reductase